MFNTAKRGGSGPSSPVTPNLTRLWCRKSSRVRDTGRPPSRSAGWTPAAVRLGGPPAAGRSSTPVRQPTDADTHEDAGTKLERLWSKHMAGVRFYPAEEVTSNASFFFLKARSAGSIEGRVAESDPQTHKLRCRRVNLIPLLRFYVVASMVCGPGRSGWPRSGSSSSPWRSTVDRRPVGGLRRVSRAPRRSPRRRRHKRRRGVSGRGWPWGPSSRSARNRLRHLPAMCGSTPSRPATSIRCARSAQARTLWSSGPTLECLALAVAQHHRITDRRIRRIRR